MKLLGALGLLLPAVQVAALPGNFGLRIGPNVDDPVVVKSPNYPDYYIVDTSVRGGPALKFEFGPKDILIDQDDKSVFVDRFDQVTVSLDIEMATLGFFFDKEDRLRLRGDDTDDFYVCELDGSGKKSLRFTSYIYPDCEEVEIYKIVQS